MRDDVFYTENNDYDFIINGNNEIMLVIYAPDDPVDSDITAFLFNRKESEATLVRNKDSLMIFSVTDELAELLTGGLTTILVNEIDSEGNTVNIYDAKIEMDM